jgi:phosphatidylserine/phosphatidylglycerophosphate/cardiolipin synthase-like enzyme
MNAAEASLRLVEELPDSLVESVIQQLRRGVAPVVPNPGYQTRVADFAQVAGIPRQELAAMLEVASVAKRSRPTAELVWTGPATPIVPVRQTEQVIFDLIQCAETRLTVMSFGIFNVPRLIEGLEAALARAVDVRIVLGERESQTDWVVEQQTDQLGRNVSANATVYRWPADRRLRDTGGRSGLMHVKAIVADSRVAFLTSANLTEAAFELNMELGVLIRGGHLPGTIDSLVDSLLELGTLQPILT